jgi:hypothetical protein
VAAEDGYRLVQGEPKLPGLPHCFGTGRTMRQLPRSFEGLVSLRIQIQNDSLFGLHITSETWATDFLPAWRYFMPGSMT